MRTFDCFTDKRTCPVSKTPPRTPRTEAYIAAQRLPLSPPCAPFEEDGIADAARAWLAHVDAGRIGSPNPPPVPSTE